MFGTYLQKNKIKESDSRVNEVSFDFPVASCNFVRYQKNTRVMIV